MEELTSSVKDVAGSVTKKLASKAIDHIKGFSDEYLEDRMAKGKTVEGSKKMTVMALLSSVAQLGKENLNDDDDDDDDDEDEDGNSLKHPNELQDHFTDKLIDRLVSKLSRSKDRQQLREKLSDVRRGQKPRLSLAKTTENFKNLSYRVGSVIDLQRQIVSIIKWDHKWKTMTYMFLYTWGCLHPYLFLVYPIVLFCGMVMIPNYLDRNLTSKPDMLPEKPREPDSAFDFLKVTQDESTTAMENERASLVREELFEKKLVERGYYGSSEITTPLSSAAVSENEDSGIHQTGEIYNAVADSMANNVFMLTGDVETTAKPTEGADLEPSSASGEKSSRFVKNLSLLINMRDLQNLTTDIVRILGDAELLIRENCSFTDEETSTVLFYRLILLAAVICVFGAWIPWCAVFIFVAWGLVLWNHPARALFLDFLMEKSENMTKRQARDPESGHSRRKRGWLDDIILDEPVVQKEVAIFEVQKQDLADISMYHPFIYSNSCFTVSSSSRRRKKRPVGSTNLNMIKPPSRKWKFVAGSQWKPDTEKPLKWIFELGLQAELSSDDEEEGWAYDNSGEYRRRRLIRAVFWSPA